MAAFMNTPGPKTLFVGYQGGLVGPIFLGTCVTAPEPEINPNFIEVFNDFGGRSVPFDTVWDGATAQVPITINRMDLVQCRAIKTQPSHSPQTTAQGLETNFARGSLMNPQDGRLGQNMYLWIVNTYFGGPNATPDMGPGRKYLSAELVAYKESTVGTRVEEIAMIFKCYPVWLGATANPQFQLFSENPSDFTGLIPN